MVSKKRQEKPTRYRRAKANSSIFSAQKTIEAMFGLPRGSIKLVYPSGRRARTDSTVGVLRDHWEIND